jgi:hypothetical protein
MAVSTQNIKTAPPIAPPALSEALLGAFAWTVSAPTNGNGHAHGSDVRLIVTRHGLVRECRKCGKAVA